MRITVWPSPKPIEEKPPSLVTTCDTTKSAAVTAPAAKAKMADFLGNGLAQTKPKRTSKALLTTSNAVASTAGIKIFTKTASEAPATKTIIATGKARFLLARKNKKLAI
jgi:hypothetical protein